jgi:hypothetical protein
MSSWAIRCSRKEVRSDMSHNIPKAAEEELERVTADTRLGVQMAMAVRQGTGRAASGRTNERVVRVRYNDEEDAEGPITGLAADILADEGYTFREAREGYGGPYAVYEVE